MKKPLVLVLSLAVVLLVGILILASQYRKQSALYAQSRQAEETVRTQFNSALESIAEIQDSLSAIVPEEGAMGIAPTPEMGGAQTQRERMLNTIANLKESIRFTGQRIRDLEASLEGSRTEVAGLKRVIDNLKRSVAEKEAMVQRLTAKVDSLGVVVTGLQADVRVGQEKIAEQQIAIAEKRREIGTIHYVIGTRKELKEKGIIVERGGFLGFGKTPQLSGTFAQGDFTPLDTDEVTEIPIAGKEPRVLTGQSQSSYQMQLDGEEHATLRILDPQEFRKIRYLVIMLG